MSAVILHDALLHIIYACTRVDIMRSVCTPPCSPHRASAAIMMDQHSAQSGLGERYAVKQHLHHTAVVVPLHNYPMSLVEYPTSLVGSLRGVQAIPEPCNSNSNI
jgi:hypothetical protein